MIPPIMNHSGGSSELELELELEDLLAGIANSGKSADLLESSIASTCHFCYGVTNGQRQRKG